ncbi:MAG: hypothetical protein RID81_11800 [Sandaracinaceae bacterium]
MTAPRPRTFAWAGLAVAGTLGVGALAWPYTVDDAFVLARYAARLAAGAGWTMNDGPPTDGVTGPLGLVPGALAAWLGADPVAAAKLVGLLAAALAAGLVARRRGPVAAALLLSSPLLAVWAIAGLETGLATLAATIAGLAARDAGREPAWDAEVDPAAQASTERAGETSGAEAAPDAGADSGADSDSEAEAEAEAVSGAVAVAEAAADSGADAGAVAEAAAESGAAAEAAADAGAVAEAAADSGAVAEAAADSGAEAEAATGAEAVAGAAKTADGAAVADAAADRALPGPRDFVPSPAPRRASWRPAAALGLSVASLAWLRPELAVFSCVLLLSLRRHRLLAWGLAFCGAAGVVAFRLALFDHALPLAAAAKPADLANGFGYLARALVVVFGVGGLLPLGLAARDDGAARPLVLALLGHAGAVALAGGDWMPGFRLFVPVIPLYAYLAAGPIARRLPSWRGWALLAGSALLPLASYLVVLPLARDAGQARETAGEGLATWLERHSRRVALVDVGFLAYRSGVEVVDLGGITDPDVAYLPGGHAAKELDVGWLAARDPDTIVLSSRAPPRVDEAGRLLAFAGHPVEHRVASTAWFRARYRVVRVVPYSSSTTYVVLARHGR